ncbi:MAG: hypothetical protein SGI97_10960 [candidate division Zixibacteria bacterium]|nr:hypothetical protein [candidate division Zixibacteria bacterium]
MSRIEITNPPLIGFDAARLDVSRLVGHFLIMYSEQFPGKELVTKVLSTQQRMLLIDSSGNQGLIDSLVNNQTVVVKFTYKEQLVSIRAHLKRSGGGRCYLVLDDRITPLTQRRFQRIPLVTSVKLAAIPKISYSQKGLSHLRWMETESINFSSGGLLISIPSFLEKTVNLLVNFEVENETFPSLVLAHVRHCYHIEHGRYQAGIEFLTRDLVEKQFPADRLRTFPAAVLEYTAQLRDIINRNLQKKDLDKLKDAE